MTTKREAKFIMQLPDDYDYTFFKDTHIVGIRSDKPPIMYKIEGEKLVPCELVFAPQPAPVPVQRDGGEVMDSMNYRPYDCWKS